MTNPLRRMLSALRQKRAAREEIERLAGEQAALRRVATLVARGATPGAVLAAVAEEVGHVLPEADFAMVGRYNAGLAVEVAGAWSRAGGDVLAGRQAALGGRNVSTLVFQAGRPARVDDLADGGDAVTVAARQLGMHSAAGAPVSVKGGLWGVMIAASTRTNALPADAEHRLAAFTELMAAAIASAQARADLSACRARLVATADETRRRIERDLHDGAQQRLVSLGLQLRRCRRRCRPGSGACRLSLAGLRQGWRARWRSCASTRAASTRRSSPTAGWRPR